MDADYFIQHVFNCFSSKTKFVTDKGTIAFKDCIDGQKVNVLTKDGKWAPATVRCYGRRTMQTVTLQCGRTTKTVKCTPDHRWILKDGTVTTNLRVGDRLWCLPEIEKQDYEYDENFCFGMILADGNDTFCKGHEDNGHYLRIRLCGDKTKYIGTFLKNGYKLSSFVFENGDVILTKKTKITKKGFLLARAWDILSIDAKRQLFEGYFAGDGSEKYNRVTTTNPRILEMIQDLSAITGRHITSITHEIRDTNFKQGAELDTVRFMKSQHSNRNWIVKNIEIDPHYDAYDAWCVEEPSTHSFTLDGGIVTGNCCLVDLENILQNGTVINGTKIEKPHSFSTACNIATQVSAIIASNQYGGQTMSFTHLAPFVDVSRQRIKKEIQEDFPNIDQQTFDKIVLKRVRDEVARGVQTIQYQILTLNSSNGQTPFITLFMYLNEAKDQQTKDDLALIIEEVLKQRIRGVKNEVGLWITPSFPKLIYTLEPDNITPDSKYWYLTELAAKCTAKRLVPDYISEKKMIELKGACFPAMGCRSFLSPWRSELVVKNDLLLDVIDEQSITVKQLWNLLTKDKQDVVEIEPVDIFVNHKMVNGKLNKHQVKKICKQGQDIVAYLLSELVFYGRNNQGVCTLNLPYIALQARRVVQQLKLITNLSQLIDLFWRQLDHHAELCHKALQCRHARLLNTSVETSPLHWMYGALSRLEKGSNFNELLIGNYSTISLGYSGLYECVRALTGHTHTDLQGHKIAIEIMQKLNDYCNLWKAKENIGYSVYGTPILSTTYKFALANRNTFGKIPEVTDHDYITNSSN